MICDLQKASVLKRISAWLLDAILLSVLAVGCIWGISGLIGYDTQSDKLEAFYTQYEATYNITFDYMTYGIKALSEAEQAAYNAMTEAEQIAFHEAYVQTCNEAFQAMNANEEMIFTYNLVLQMTLLMICLGVFLAVLLLEFVIPLCLGNGQTVGKKIFSLAVMRTNSVRINGVSLFIRTILGKYAVEIMIPVFIVTMWLLQILGLEGTIVLAVLLLAQAILVITTNTNSLIHDKLADTVVVDMSSQMIFDSPEARLAYQKELASQKAERQTY